MKTVSVILPTYNESLNIEEMIKRVSDNVKNLLEIIVVDDNSPDGTWQIVEKLQEKNKKIKLIRRINERGIASALERGIKNSKGDIIVWMDCDSTQPPELIPSLADRLKECDIAVASRYVKGGRDKRKIIRVITSKLFNLYADILLGVNVKDMDSGFIAVKREVFKKVEFPGYGYGEYFVEFIYKAVKRGFTLTEVGYVFKDREKGESKTADNITNLLKYGWQYGIKVLKLRFWS